MHLSPRVMAKSIPLPLVSKIHHNECVRMDIPGPEPIFSPAIIIRQSAGDTYHLEIFEKAGQFGRSDPKLQDDLDPGEPYEYRDYRGRQKLVITICVIDPE
jgi:hypothetical protein